MSCLLNGEQGEIRPAPPKQKEKKEFQLPLRNGTMRRVYAYLLKQRLISRNVLDAFVHAGLIYESQEPSKSGNDYHNAVFVGLDGHGVPRHAHKRSLYSTGPGLKRNVGGCDPRYSFHHTGNSDRLYVFEAPVDLLSFLTLYQKNWQIHSYAALCGTSEHAMLWMLEQNPDIRNVLLCLDHDEAGIEANGRLTEILRGRGYSCISVLQPEHKDWNEDLKAAHGLPAFPAEEHPQVIVAPDICQLITEKCEEVKPDSLGSLEKELPRLLLFSRTMYSMMRLERQRCARTRRLLWRWPPIAGSCGSLALLSGPQNSVSGSARKSCPTRTTPASKAATGNSAPKRKRY